MFRSSTIIRELVLSLAKVMLIHLCFYRLCGGVAACLGVACVLCAVQNETELGSFLIRKLKPRNIQQADTQTLLPSL
jgi:hypothetical protein